MRDIRFRAWDKKYNTMLNDIDTDELFKRHGLDNCQMLGFVLMQFTGLRDKNGKEVFENDILRRPSVLYGHIDAPVEYHDEAFWYGSDLLMNYYGTAFEVIGNIYEHPDLLKP